MSFPFVSVVIPAFNEEQYLPYCLESIVNADYPRDKLQIILVDNGSTDKTLAVAEKFDVEVYVKEDVNVGAVRNFGVTKSVADIIVFLDSDCVVCKSWLLDGVRSVEEAGGVVGGGCLLRDNASWVERGWVLRSSRDVVCQKTLLGGCIFIERELFLSVGGFDEGLSAGEDTDLNAKLVRSGRSVLISPSLSVVHLGYPNTILSFIKRQRWHSEDYFQRLPGVIADKVFLITQLYLLSLVCLVGFIIAGGYPEGVLLSAAVGLACPAVLTLKRVRRYQIGCQSFRLLLTVYVIDCLYLLGRLLGTFRSIRKLLFGPGRKKCSRR